MNYPSRAVTDLARTRLRADFHADSQLPVQPAVPAVRAPQLARTSAGRSVAVVATVAVLAMPFVFALHGCTFDLHLAELSIPGLVFGLKQNHA